MIIDPRVFPEALEGRLLLAGYVEDCGFWTDRGLEGGFVCGKEILLTSDVAVTI